MTGPPIAEIVCAPRSEMVQILGRQYGENQIGIGVRDPETVFELWSSEGSGDWTLVLSYNDGKSCIVAMGDDWQAIEPPAS